MLKNKKNIIKNSFIFCNSKYIKTKLHFMEEYMNSDNFIGIDIGGTKCTVVLGNPYGKIIDKVQFLTKTTREANYTINKIFHAINTILKENKVSMDNIEAIGISSVGPVDSKKGIVISPPILPNWNNVAIGDVFRNRFNKNVYLQNDANACAIAEWRFGAGKNCKNMIFLTFDTGVRAGLILDGRLYTGANDMAGEVGHIRLSREGPLGYGKFGSFEGYCSGSSIAKLAYDEIAKRIKRGYRVKFCETLEEAKNITVKEVAIAAENGDKVAIDILRTSARYLGMGLSILIDMLNPEKIIIGSTFARCREFLQPTAEKIIKKEALELSYKNCSILPSSLGENIGEYACLSVALGENY